MRVLESTIHGMKMRYFLITFFIVSMAVNVCVPVVLADTVELKNNEFLKGVIVEEYKDRVIISTMDGEKQLMRENIEELVYDREEQNLVSLAEVCQDQGAFRKAYYYYNKALEINPEYKKAREGLNYVSMHVVNSDRRQKLAHVERLNEGEQERKGISRVEEVQDKRKRVRDELGMILMKVQQRSKISNVVLGSPAAKAGIRKGDILLAAWGRAASYMDPEEVLDMLLSATIDVQITVECLYKMNLKAHPKKYGNAAGIKLGYSEMEGMIVDEVYEGTPAALAGIKKGDIILEVQGQTVRYMTTGDVVGIINSRKDDILFLLVKRDVIVWKNFADSGDSL